MRLKYETLKLKIYTKLKKVEEHKKDQYIIISSLIFIIVFIFSFSLIYHLDSKYKETQKLFKIENEISKEQLSQLTISSEKIKDLEVQNTKIRSENMELSAKIKKYSPIAHYFEAYWDFVYAMDTSFLEINGPLWTNTKMDKELIKMLEKHVKAMYSRDEKAFMETILSGGPDDEYTKYYMLDEKHYHAEIRIIADYYMYSGGGYIPICVVYQKEKGDKPQSTWYYVQAVKYSSGKWYLIDYS